MSLSYQELASIRNPDARLAELKRHLADADEALLLGCFDDSSFPIRAAAARVLRERLDDALVVEVLERTSTPQGRVCACMALGVPREDTYSRLLEWTADFDADVRYEALVSANRVVGDLGGDALDRLHSAVVERLKTEADVGVVVVAAQICAERAWTDAFESLRERYERMPRGFLRPNRDRFQFACTLAELTQTTPVDAAFRDTLRRDLEAQLMRDECSTPASRALAQLGDARAVPALERVASAFRVHPIHRVEAAVALVRLGHAGGVMRLRSFLEGRRKEARGWAMIQAGRLRIGELRELIETAAEAVDYHADTAVLALRLYDDEDARARVARVADAHEDEDLRRHAADVLTHWEQKDVV